MNEIWLSMYLINKDDNSIKDISLYGALYRTVTQVVFVLQPVSGSQTFGLNIQQYRKEQMLGGGQTSQSGIHYLFMSVLFPKNPRVAESPGAFWRTSASKSTSTD